MQATINEVKKGDGEKLQKLYLDKIDVDVPLWTIISLQLLAKHREKLFITFFMLFDNH